MLLLSLPLLPQPAAAGSPDAARQLPVGTILQVLRRQSSNQQRWVQVRVCTLPDAPAVGTPATAIDKLNIKPGDTGWLAEATAAPLVTPTAAIEQGACTPAAAPPSNPSPASTPAGNQVD
ncbi:MAG: hypothetical protein HC895_18355 [Leptolyngbyaceae cyanobacterium SM1_3_5]|nr:hypothetical protein [Leptolyngbyaceae cyanobacterium SM1_3_5]